MPILNYTTTIAPEKTLTEIQKRLVRIGAQAIMSEFDGSGVMCALSFRINHQGQPVTFRLPARLDSIYRVLANDPKVPMKLKTHEQASRVAWRIIKDWVEAQAAIVEAEQAEVIEVFLPYAQDPNTGNTLYQKLEQSNFGLLTYQGDQS